MYNRRRLGSDIYKSSPYTYIIYIIQFSRFEKSNTVHKREMTMKESKHLRFLYKQSKDTAAKPKSQIQFGFKKLTTFTNGEMTTKETQTSTIPLQTKQRGNLNRTKTNSDSKSLR